MLQRHGVLKNLLDWKLTIINFIVNVELGLNLTTSAKHANKVIVELKPLTINLQWIEFISKLENADCD